MCIAEVCEVSLRQQHLDPDVFNGSIVMSLPFIGQRYQLFIQTSLLLPEYFAYEKYCACVRACVRVHFDVGLVAGLDNQINSMQSLHTKSNVKSCSIPFGFFGVDAVWDYVIKYMSKKNRKPANNNRPGSSHRRLFRRSDECMQLQRLDLRLPTKICLNIN